MFSTTIPNSSYEVKQKLRDLGLGYETIHACTMSSFSINFEETDALFLEFRNKLNNAEGSSSVGDNSGDVNSFDSWNRSGGLILDENISRLSRALYSIKCSLLSKSSGKNCHRNFKEYNDPEQARTNLPHILVGRLEDWYFLCDHYMILTFQEQSQMNKAARQKQPYNHSSRSKSFLQQQHELTKQQGQPVDRMELFKETQS
ncbi:CACTA en-spm transposon protein [Cucumis melo var. makuwa]|uniref:CACTA en-spm transposon protein n=1 Tax=Cucumis melo var. makuwa TaxID=1194695 RepID=A0A5A7T1Z4_CUCMM|nr:CACTA en-spm transposon protein [Cucumis melo var. makuwa]TYK19740.1 CACTA en-spm transposon protein [Cucumis melo var. makuwa]